MKKAIVTGANGFVGYWLLKELVKNGVSVIAVIKDSKEDISRIKDLSGVDIEYCNLDDLKSLPEKLKDKDKGFDAFYHLAWVSAGGPGRADYEIQLKNVKYACDAVKVAAELKCKKILFAGTVTERLVERIDLLNAKALNNIYGVCKNTTHYLTQIEAKRYGIECIWMQFANLYGPFSINGNIVGYTIKELIEGKNATFGPANQLYDLLNIKDLVKAAFLLGTKETKQFSYYIGSGQPRLLKDYLIRIGELCNKPDHIMIGSRPDDGTRYEPEWFNINSLVTDTGFSPSINFDSGIIETIEWMKSIKI